MFKFKFIARMAPLLLLPLLFGGITLAKAQRCQRLPWFWRRHRQFEWPRTGVQSNTAGCGSRLCRTPTSLPK